MKVVVYASQLAGLVGRNYYAPQQQVLASMLKRLHPDVFAQAEQRTAKIASSKEQLKQANLDVDLHVKASTSREANQLLQATLKQSLAKPLDKKTKQVLTKALNDTLQVRHSSTLAEQVEQVERCVEARLGPNFRKELATTKLQDLDVKLLGFLKDESATTKLSLPKFEEIIQGVCVQDSKALSSSLRQVVNTSRGIDGEDPSIKLYESIKRTRVTQNNAQLFSKRLGTTTFVLDDTTVQVQVVLVGKVDGFCDGKVVEVKNRQKRFFTQIPAYEKVQLLAYMFLTNTLEAEHVECFDQQLKSRRVEFDQEEFQQITQCALEQAKVFAELVHDVLKQDALLTWMVDNHKTIS